ncbi:MAG: sigma-54 dependent transcriptional regulator [Ignavibacteria bacterium]|nr:sigma-54 dependent transcriptional regulator [Ignavibacteria bacterium]
MVETIVAPRTTVSPSTSPVGLPKSRASEPILISRSPMMEAIRSRISLVAQSHATVLITGETGTGKEVIARLVHHQSNARQNRFIATNCATLPRDVIDNELFGHEREAFTGAASRKPGCFELADGGTLFLDEVAEMHAQSQVKLLRAIETKSFRRLGGSDEIMVDARIIAATNRDISHALSSGELREDLYYRLSVVEIHLPPLRERKEDIPLLAKFFLDLNGIKYGIEPKQLSPDALECLSLYEWPGNIREFKNLMESLTLICPMSVITADRLPARFSPAIATPSGKTITVPVGCTLAEAERLLITSTLERANGNKAQAARILGLSRKSLYDKLAAYRGERAGSLKKVTC